MFRSHEAGEQPHSITSSARSNTVCGIVSPSALAVFRDDRSKRVDCMTGKSARAAPSGCVPRNRRRADWIRGGSRCSSSARRRRRIRTIRIRQGCGNGRRAYDIGVEKKAQSSMRLGRRREGLISRPTRGIDQEILEALGRLRADKIAIGDDHNGILAVPCHELRTVAQRPIDNLAKPRLGVLKFPGVHFPGPSTAAVLRLTTSSRRVGC